MESPAIISFKATVLTLFTSATGTPRKQRKTCGVRLESVWQISASGCGGPERLEGTRSKKRELMADQAEKNSALLKQMQAEQLGLASERHREVTAFKRPQPGMNAKGPVSIDEILPSAIAKAKICHLVIQP